MKIFITMPWFAPAYKAGGPIQSIVNLINNYTENVTYFIFCSDQDLDKQKLQNIETNKWIYYTSNTKVWYASKKNIAISLKNQIAITQPDALFIIGLFSLAFNIYPLLCCKVPIKIISVRGMLHSGALSQKALKKQIFISFLRATFNKKNTIFHATDIDEAACVKLNFGSNTIIKIASNFPNILQPVLPIYKNTGELKLITIALISPMKNHLLVLQALSKCSGNVVYNIYGPIKDPVYWAQCLATIASLPKNIQVFYQGTILPSQIENALAQNHVFIMPSKSENFGHSFCEALYAGKPVITSYTTPWLHLQENNAGVNVTFFNNELANAIQLFVNMEHDVYYQYTQAAIKYIHTRIDIKHLKNQYHHLFFN